MKTFDPYRDRLARDIRNGLSSALVQEIAGEAAGSLSRQVDVYVHVQRGKEIAAQGLANRAVRHLRQGRRCLAFIANLDEIIEALSSPKVVAPQMLPAR